MRRRYVYDHATGAIVEVPLDYTSKPRRNSNILPDLDSAYGGGFTSPINGEYITSRSQLRDHERRHSVKQCGDYKPGEIVAREKARVQRTRDLAKSGDPLKWM